MPKHSEEQRAEWRRRSAKYRLLNADRVRQQNRARHHKRVLARLRTGQPVRRRHTSKSVGTCSQCGTKEIAIYAEAEGEKLCKPCVEQQYRDLGF